MARMTIGNLAAGDNEPCFIIAEAGVNHNGSLKLARELIDAAANAGASAVKFQTFRSENLVTDSAGKAGYQKETTGSGESQYDMLKQLELSETDFRDLFAYAEEKEIIFLSSPFDPESADFLAELGVPAFKVPSGEITNTLLLERIGRYGKPVILSTGMAELDEIETALNVLKQAGARDIILLHCVTAYPTKVEDVNLRFMQTLKEKFNVPVGFSDHTVSTVIPAAAVALGACVIEKHMTLDKTMTGPDHRASLEPAELAQMVTGIRETEAALGDGQKRFTVEEQENRKVARRGLVAERSILAGETLSADMIGFKRSSSESLGYEYRDRLIGLTIRRPMKAGEPFTGEDLK